MPIDPKKLSSMAGAVKRPGSSKLVQSTKKFRPKPAEEEEEEELEDEDAAEEFAEGEEEETGFEEDHEEPELPEGDPEEMEEEIAEGNVPPPKGPRNPGAAIPALEQYASEVEACCDELDYDVLTDPDLEMSDEDIAIMQEGVLMLPPRLLKVLDQLAEIDYDAAFTIATHLEEEGMVSDSQRIAGWIYRVGQLLAEEGEPEEDMPLEEEDEEYAEEDEGYMGEGDEA